MKPAHSVGLWNNWNIWSLDSGFYFFFFQIFGAEGSMIWTKITLLLMVINTPNTHPTLPALVWSSVGWVSQFYDTRQIRVSQNNLQRVQVSLFFLKIYMLGKGINSL
jgi:hypothetical protein